MNLLLCFIWQIRARLRPVFLCLLLFAGGGVVGNAQEPDLMVPRTYEARYAKGEITIDGRALESDWQRVPFSETFTDIKGILTPKYDTRMKMMWGDTYLYFYAEMEEPHVWGTLKQRDTVIFYNNDFEIFMDPDGDTHEYYEFEMNALNTVWDLLLVKPYRNGGRVLDHWDMHGMQSAVHIQGTLNNAGDRDKGWSIEVAIPWDVLAETAGMPVPPVGKFWRINFSRVNWDFELREGKYSRKRDEQGKFLPEYNWVWSPQQVVNMHQPERWGYVYFSSEGEEGHFVIPETESLKWELFGIYRELMRNSQSLLHQIRLGQARLPERSYKGAALQTGIEFHEGGWNLVANDPGSTGVHLIREDGKYIFKK